MFRSVRQAGSRNTQTEVNIAPLIDMVFILLIFFLVTTTFVKETGIKVDKPQAAASESLDSQSLRIGIASSGSIYVEGQRVGLDELRDRVRRFVHEEKRGMVVIIPDERVSAGRLVAVMDACKLGGAKDLAVATQKRGAR